MSTETVTALSTLPLLVSSTTHEQEGEVTFQDFLRPFPVRRVTREVLTSDPFLQCCSKEQMQEFGVVVELIQAYKLRSKPGYKEKGKRIWKETVNKLEQLVAARRDTDAKIGFRGPEDEKKDLEWGRWLISNEDTWGGGLETKNPKRAAALWSGHVLTPRIKAKPSLLLSLILSKHLSGLRVVLWWWKKSLQPALYCEQIHSAFYVKALLSLAELRGLAVCRYSACNKIFQQSRSDQECCSARHRDANRMAHYRLTPAGRLAMKRDAMRRKRKNALRPKKNSR
jgi:hypothetical protein